MGRAGAGKTTIAVELGRRLNLPVIHLDPLFWTAQWKEVGRLEFENRQQKAVSGDRWIIDGGYLSSAGWPARLIRSDLVIVVDAPLAICLWRVICRSLLRSRPRPDRPDGARERLSPYFLWWIATWSLRHPNLAATIRERYAGRVVVVRRSEDLEGLI